VLKNRNYPQLSEANFHARLRHSKQLLKNTHPMMSSDVSIVLFTGERHLQ